MKNIIYVIASIYCCSFVMSSVSASELVLRDIRVMTELLPSSFDFTNTSTLQNTSGSDEFESSLGLSAGALVSWSAPGSSSGWLLGGALTTRQQSIGSTSDISSYGFRGIAGYAYAYNDRFTFSLEPFIGFGLASTAIGSTRFVEGFTMDGNYYEYGLNLQTIISLNSNWQSVFGVGYVTSSMSFDGGPDQFESQIDSNGLYASIGFSWRWNTSPWTLE